MFIVGNLCSATSEKCPTCRSPCSFPEHVGGTLQCHWKFTCGAIMQTHMCSHVRCVCGSITEFGLGCECGNFTAQPCPKEK